MKKKEEKPEPHPVLDQVLTFDFTNADKNVAEFKFHKNSAQAYSNFISDMNTGKPDYLFK